MTLPPKSCIAHEFHSSEVSTYSRDKDGSIKVFSTTNETGILSRSIKSSIKSVFLPAGFPESVSSDYVTYQIWDSLQAFCSSLTHTLATHAVLKGAGVGDASATPLAATITWLLKDGTGMLGSILFAYVRGSSLDSECKKWRLFADVVNDLSFLVDLISSLFPLFFLPIQCFSGLMRSLVGVAGGATRAALTQHQARRNNLADVSAKDGSQETLVNLMALMVNLMVVPLVVSNLTVVWTMFTLLTFLHIFCNYKAVKSVNMEVFNTSRLTNTVKEFLNTNSVLTPLEANQLENVWFFIPEKPVMQLGVSLAQHEDLNRLSHQKQRKHYLTLKCGKPIVSISRNCNTIDIIKAAFHAINVAKDVSFIDDFNKTDKMLDQFVTECEKVGWSFDKQLLTCGEYRYDYTQVY